MTIVGYQLDSYNLLAECVDKNGNKQWYQFTFEGEIINGTVDFGVYCPGKKHFTMKPVSLDNFEWDGQMVRLSIGY